MNKSKAVILIVDDEINNRELLCALLHAKGYATLTANSGDAGLRMANEQLPDLILLDVMMPVMNGYQVAKTLKQGTLTAHIPIIMISALDDRDSRLAGLDAGAEDFLTKPIDRAELWVRVRNMLRLKEYRDFLDRHNVILEQKILERTQELDKSHARLRDSYIETIFTMTRAAEYKDEDTGAHVQRISYYSKCLGETLGMDADFVDAIFYSSPMHDIGKIGIADAVLLKPGRFTDEEFEIMKTHSSLGAEILGFGSSPYMVMGADIALNHHERWDGSGYPGGLKKEAIPLSARIMSICDIYDALRSKRPYKLASDHAKTINIIAHGDSRTRPEHFDPSIFAAFMENHQLFQEIFEAYSK